MWGLVEGGLALVLLGFGIIVATMLRSSESGESGVKGAAVIMIGPIPLVFGSDAKWASIAIALAILLLLMSLVLYVV